ncbi:MAG TPA: zinc-binding alcohol dehydrogenase [Cytophagales bacterium]|nr:zinc-binding alcohol dehydrogenase [Cytophagales bacterium]
MQVHAHGLNPKDYSIRSGHLQWITGKRFPMQIGSDAAGVVEAVGEKVTHWKPGDRVFGYLNLYHGGAASEFCRFSEKAIARIPEGVDYVTAAAIPCANLTALQALRDWGRLKAQQRVLLIGASGGVGSAAIQIAKVLGAHVTAVSSSANVDYCYSLGADVALSYQTDNPYAPDLPYDLVLQVHGGRQPFYERSRPVLKRRGRFVMLVPSPKALANIVLSRLLPWPRYYFFPVRARTRDLALLGQWVTEGKLVPQVSKVYPYDQLVEAHRQIDSAHTRGKLVLRVAD